MRFLNKLERKFGRYAIHNLSLYLIIGYVIGYVIELFYPSMLNYLTLDPYAILHGQVWRLITWVLNPPSGLDIFTIIMLFFYYSLGTNLERTWGAFRYNVYIFGGILFSDFRYHVYRQYGRASVRLRGRGTDVRALVQSVFQYLLY